MQTASFDYTIRNVEGTTIGTASYADEALDAGAAEHERTGEVVTVHAPDGTEVACNGDGEVARVALPASVAEQLEEVRQDGRVNMLDRHGVQVVADGLGLFELVRWIEDHQREYGRLIFEGFDVEPVSGGR